MQPERMTHLYEFFRCAQLFPSMSGIHLCAQHIHIYRVSRHKQTTKSSIIFRYIPRHTHNSRHVQTHVYTHMKTHCSCFFPSGFICGFVSVLHILKSLSIQQLFVLHQSVRQPIFNPFKRMYNIEPQFDTDQQNCVFDTIYCLCFD